VFDFYHCGGLSATLLGFAQIDRAGNVNVSMFNGVFRGSGGFIDIVHKTKKIMFCGTLTSGKLDVAIEQGKVNILNEGKHKKFIPEVEQLTFNAKVALKNKQEVLYLTERAVFRLEDQGITLIEYAPGVDIERDILSHIDFKVNISPNLREMDADIFK
jgi:propionate CoA-transferase